MKGYAYQNQNVSMSIFINTNNNTATVIPGGPQSPESISAFKGWFDGILKEMNDQNQQKRNTHWRTTTTCHVDKCT